MSKTWGVVLAVLVVVVGMAYFFSNKGVSHSVFCEEYSKDLPVISRENELLAGEIVGVTLTPCEVCDTYMFIISSESRQKKARVVKDIWILFKLGDRVPRAKQD